MKGSGSLPRKKKPLPPPTTAKGSHRVNIIACAGFSFKRCWQSKMKGIVQMSNVLEELYYGNIYPDTKLYRHHPLYVESSRCRTVNLDKLMELFNEREKELFEKYCTAQAEMDDIIQYTHFTYGFKLGVLLITEVFMDKNGVFGDDD